ncbi:proprotein convertase subtilisin/kexin type 4 isoform X5 [Pelodiscus sinensis]|uniref:proprotein convertase subtilisin/kexin type 4 isoform X5 n=1 Tax=Pelodiscus sinensis TaxID=13735 RepID=UPI003F6D683B
MATPGCEHVARGSPSSPARARERGKIEAPASGGALGRRSRAGGYLRAPFRGQPHVCSPPPVGAMAGAAAWLRLSLLLAGASCCRGGLTVYLSSWAVQVPAGAREAERLARKHGLLCLGQIIEGDHYYHFKHRGMVQKSLNRHWGWHVHLKREPKVHWFEQQTLKRRTKRTIAVVPTDPWFHKQWYMNNDVHPDLNILTAWSKGYTGLGVVLSILDDGLERDHPDLSANYDPLASYDFNSNDPDPQPRYNLWDENRHGTRCAGEVAAAANNRLCGVGVAYNAKIGGVRMLDGPITDIVEAQSLSFHPQHIHIYSASWGPEDDGKTVDGPGILALEAFYSGIANGRGGLGSLFVWASGNGGLRYDNCNCDGYTNSIYTLSVGSATENGRLPWYSEACASTLTATYSSGTKGEKQIVTTDLRHRCTDKHTGTSASAPLAAGMIALALEANPALTWRDIQHLVVRASKPAHLQAEDWALTGVGRKVSHHYGYGLLDAGDLVDLARKWTPTGPQRKCSVKVISAPLKIGSKLTVSKNVSTCLRRARHIRSLEHVQVRVSLSYSRRGDLAISLSSPMGTTSTLVAVRPYDTSTQGYKDWSFMSTHFWDEDPRGTWTLFLENKGDPYNTGLLTSFILQLYGTDEDMMARQIAASVVSECARRDATGACEECASPFYAFQHLCLSYCPPRFYNRSKRSPAPEGSPHAAQVCATCHPSCYTCRGATANNCTACPPSCTFHEPSHSCSPPAFAARFPSPVAEHRQHLAFLLLAILLGGGPLLVGLLCVAYHGLALAASRRQHRGPHPLPPTAGMGGGRQTGTRPRGTGCLKEPGQLQAPGPPAEGSAGHGAQALLLAPEPAASWSLDSAPMPGK